MIAFDSRPRLAIVGYLVIETAERLYFAKDLTDYIVDDDGNDFLTFSVPDFDDRKKLEKFNLEFNPANNFISGDPTSTGTLAMIKV